jgi:hypothetical protein
VGPLAEPFRTRSGVRELDTPATGATTRWRWRLWLCVGGFRERSRAARASVGEAVDSGNAGLGWLSGSRVVLVDVRLFVGVRMAMRASAAGWLRRCLPRDACVHCRGDPRLCALVWCGSDQELVEVARDHADSAIDARRRLLPRVGPVSGSTGKRVCVCVCVGEFPRW